MIEHRVPTQTLHRWVVDLWFAAGSNPHEAALNVDNLVGANLAGHDSHGIGMVPRYVNSWLTDELQLNQDISFVQDSGNILVVDGQRGMGQSVTHKAMQLAIERSLEHGVCVMGFKHSHHLGPVGHWAEQAAEVGLVSVHFANAVCKPVVAPHGGTRARFLTNPFYRRHSDSGTSTDIAGFCHQRHRVRQGARGTQQAGEGATQLVVGPAWCVHRRSYSHVPASRHSTGCTGAIRRSQGVCTGHDL